MLKHRFPCNWQKQTELDGHSRLVSKKKDIFGTCVKSNATDFRWKSVFSMASFSPSWKSWKLGWLIIDILWFSANQTFRWNYFKKTEYLNALKNICIRRTPTAVCLGDDCKEVRLINKRGTTEVKKQTKIGHLRLINKKCTGTDLVQKNGRPIQGSLWDNWWIGGLQVSYVWRTVLNQLSSKC